SAGVAGDASDFLSDSVPVPIETLDVPEMVPAPKGENQDEQPGAPAGDSDPSDTGCAADPVWSYYVEGLPQEQPIASSATPAGLPSPVADDQPALSCAAAVAAVAAVFSGEWRVCVRDGETRRVPTYRVAPANGCVDTL